MFVLVGAFALCSPKLDKLELDAHCYTVTKAIKIHLAHGALCVFGASPPPAAARRRRLAANGGACTASTIARALLGCKARMIRPPPSFARAPAGARRRRRARTSTTRAVVAARAMNARRTSPAPITNPLPSSCTIERKRLPTEALCSLLRVGVCRRHPQLQMAVESPSSLRYILGCLVLIVGVVRGVAVRCCVVGDRTRLAWA